MVFGGGPLAYMAHSLTDYVSGKQCGFTKLALLRCINRYGEERERCPELA